MAGSDSPSSDQQLGKAHGIGRTAGGLAAFKKHHPVGPERGAGRQPLKLPDRVGRKPMPFPDPAQRDMGNKGPPFRGEPDLGAGALKTVLKHFQLGTGVDLEVEHARATGSREGPARAKGETHGVDAGGSMAERIFDGVQAIGHDFAEELEGDMQPVVPDPAHRPFPLHQAPKQETRLLERGRGERDGDEEPHCMERNGGGRGARELEGGGSGRLHSGMVQDGLLRAGRTLAIPRSELIYRATRAGGPGGQHVNTSSTRIELWWNVAESTAPTERQRALLLERLASRLNREGWLRLTESGHRSQLRNREAVTERFAALVARAVIPPKQRRRTRVPAAERRRRLNAKRQRAQVKQLRGKVHGDD